MSPTVEIPVVRSAACRRSSRSRALKVERRLGWFVVEEERIVRREVAAQRCLFIELDAQQGVEI